MLRVPFRGSFEKIIAPGFAIGASIVYLERSSGRHPRWMMTTSIFVDYEISSKYYPNSISIDIYLDLVSI